MKRSRLNRQKKTPLAKLKRECEVIWKQVVLRLHQQCEGFYYRQEEIDGQSGVLTMMRCQNASTVAHHFIRRSKSMNTFLCVSNGVGLCSTCHARIHVADDKLIEAQLVLRRGEGWLNILMAMSKVKVHANRVWFETNKETLEDYLKTLKEMPDGFRENDQTQEGDASVQLRRDDLGPSEHPLLPQVQERSE